MMLRALETAWKPPVVHLMISEDSKVESWKVSDFLMTNPETAGLWTTIYVRSKILY